MKSALVIGSESFGKYMTNPTKWLALAVAGKQIAGFRIHSLVLPSVVRRSETVADSGTEIVKKAQEIDASVIVSLGMASEVAGFRLERTASNWIYNQKYCSQQENNTPLDMSRPAKEELRIDYSSIDLQKMRQLFEDAGLPFDPAISDDAGQYSCNNWIYRTLLAMQKQNISIPYAFMHVACTQEAIELIPEFDSNKVLIKKEDTVTALEIVLQAMRT